jgi:hypothetical protein
MRLTGRIFLESSLNHRPVQNSLAFTPQACSMSTTLNELFPAPVVNVAHDGDVIMIVSPDERRLRVSSAALANASEVFSRILSLHYSEGQNLGDISSGPKEVHMLEDDADAMEIICSMTCFRSIPERIESDLILLVAVAAD